MKISLSTKPYIIKACCFFSLISLIASTPLLVDASFFSDIASMVLGTKVNADETALLDSDIVVHNYQTIPLLESSVNPDLKNTNEPEDNIIVQDDSFIYSNGLSGTDINIEKSPLSDQIIIYTVKKGDTLSEIAESFDVSMNTIRWENNISGQTISTGKKLNILSVTGVKHIVKSGDTISKIADKYEAEAEDISIFNNLSKEVGLKVGQVLIVPNGIIKAVVSTTKPSSGTGKVVVSNTKVESGYYMRPVSGIITSPYGSRRGGFHPGVDIGNSRGTTVVAAASGIVINVISGCKEGAKSCGGGYGNHIEIVHPNGTTTRYAHLSKASVVLGQIISQNQTIGALGNTGNSTGPHLHFEIENANGSKMRPPV